MIRNVAIIAHVDHGKTTLVDQMLRQAGAFRANQVVEERVMDSNPLERERGITILSKNTSVRWQEHKINIVDTPGHADFGGEVERILRMVNGVLLLVDAFDGPMPQTRFVTRKALALGLQPIVVINKVDRVDSDPMRVHDEVLELFMELEAEDAQLDAPFLYASAREGWAVRELTEERRDLLPLFDAVLKRVPAPPGDAVGPFQMLVSTIDHSPYLGRLAIGRIERGTVHVGDSALLLALRTEDALAVGTEESGPADRQGRVARLYTFEGLQRQEVTEASAGEIVALAGLEGVEIGSTITDPAAPEPLAGIAVEEPTISVDFVVNTAPFSGRDGKYVTSRQLRERLFREVERNVALRVEDTDSPDTFTVSGRGELHLGILMETMRREGYEFAVSRPRIITKKAADGETLEPFEDVIIDVPESFVGVVIEKLGVRRGEMLEMRAGGLGSTGASHGAGLVRMRYKVPARGLFGYRGEFLTDTRGEGVLHHRFHGYGPWAGPVRGRERGVMVSMADGASVAYALWNLQERGVLFIGPGVDVYEGMIVGENARAGDLEVNVTKGKKLTNIRAAGADEAIMLETPRALTLESALEFIGDDELMEVTPAAIRLRKRHLKAHERKKASRMAG
jgi:GTP-binding protein